LDDYSRDLRPAEWGSGVSLRSSNPKPLMSALGQKRTASVRDDAIIAFLLFCLEIYQAEQQRKRTLH